MRYYVIINGINSLTIPGLAIKDLPPISKTLMRNQKETIDGRDGDIITELGYSAYDKALTIGLYGSYDINDIIAFFNQKGTIVFSDEPDKYYNFTILDQIDYDKLVKFRTATIRIHCQPFKYPVSETPVEIEAEYVTAQGEEMTLNDTGVAPLEIGLKGNTYQETTTGKNLCNPQGHLAVFSSTYVTAPATIITSPYTTQVNYRGVSFIAQVEANKTYVISSDISLTSKYRVGIYDSLDKVGVGSNIVENIINVTSTFTPTHSGYAVIGKSADNSGTTITWSWIQVELGSTATDYEPYTNGASPNPDYPQEVQVVTGDNTINITGKNLFNPFIIEGVATVENDGTIVIPARPTVTNGYYDTGKKLKELAPSLKVGQVYYLRLNTDFSARQYIYASQNWSNGAKTVTQTMLEANVIIYGGYTEPSHIKIMITDNSDANYETYQSQEYEINLGTLELCKIGTYQDYLYKSGENWYKHTEIGKVTLTSSMSINLEANLTNVSRFRFNNIINAKETLGICNNNRYLGAYSSDTPHFYILSGLTQIYYFIDNTLANTVNDFKTWLDNNETIVYYPLATPTEEQITNAELIGQLEETLNAVSYEDQTNISQENDNLPFILDVSALQKGTNEAIIDNDGNIYSKPIINIVGDGIVGVSLNGSQILSLDMTTYNDITIDTETMEAYDSNGLRNRQVTGNYNNLRLQPGENTISLNGGFTSATISKYKRWL